MRVANWIFGAFTSSALAELDDSALLQSRIKVHTPAQYPLPGHYCVAAGDPHIKPFDVTGQKESCLGPMGDYILMQNDHLFVHARYKGYQRDNGYAFVQGLVIGGTALGDKNINVPVYNGPCIQYGGTCLAKAYGKNTYELTNGNKLLIEKIKGPMLVSFDPVGSANDNSNELTFRIELKGPTVDFLVLVNQGIQQHVLISGDAATLAGTDGNGPTGQCGNNNGDDTDDHFHVDACPGKLPCHDTDGNPVTGNFLDVNNECGEPREPDECKDVTDPHNNKFYRHLCEHYFMSSAYTSTHVDSAPEWQLWNCIKDCCSDRDTCPDLDNNGQWADCLVEGDPHIKVWDAPTLTKSAYGPLDDYVMMKNSDLTIHGRYESRRMDNRASLVAVAVGGPLVGGDTIIFGKGFEHPPQVCLAGDCSNKVIMALDQAVYDANAKYKISYEKEGPDLRFIFDKSNAAQTNSFPLYTLSLLGANGHTIGWIMVNKPRHFSGSGAALHIRMQPQLLANVTGQCGNFNGNASDDTSSDEASMRSDIVKQTEALFEDQNSMTGSMPVNATCSTTEWDDARVCCYKRHGGGTVANPVEGSFISACAADNCCEGQAGCDPKTRCELDE